MKWLFFCVSVSYVLCHKGKQGYAQCSLATSTFLFLHNLPFFDVLCFACHITSVYSQSDIALTEAQRFWYLRLLKRLDKLSLDEIFSSTIEEDEGRKEAQALVAKAMAQGVSPKPKTYQQLMNLLMVSVVPKLDGWLRDFD